MEPIIHKTEDGTEIKVVPLEVFEQNKTALDKASEELAKTNRLLAEKTDNFKKFNEMSEEEKARHSENEIILIRRADELQKTVDDLTGKLTGFEQAQYTNQKTSILKSIYGDNADLQKTVEENYAALSGMPEKTPEEIQARAAKAAQLSGITFDQRNPLFIPTDGGAPTVGKDKKEFVETPRGQEASRALREAMGRPVEAKK